MQFFWEIPHWEQSDRDLSKMRRMPFQRPFPFIPQKPGLYIIRGPRQVGKSCWLKTILSFHAKSSKCFYQSCEEIENFQALGELLRSTKDRDLVILDEVNFVEGWDRAIKHAVDAGYPKMLIITGSHAHDLKRGADRMPGRFDEGGEFFLLPMSFDEFCEARRQAGWSSENRLSELRAYFRSGGFPTAVAESGVHSKIPRKSMDTYWRWLSGDIVKLGKSESVVREFLVQVLKTMQSPISLTSLAKKSGVGSHNTALDYMDILESCFATRTLFAIDMDTGGLRFRKDRKFYFTDPLLYWIALEHSGLKIPDNSESQLAEMVAHEHLTRRYSRFGYHGNDKGEVDFILPSQWAIEVKWSPVALNLSKTFLQLQIPEKIVWTQVNYLSEWPQLGSLIGSLKGKIEIKGDLLSTEVKWNTKS